MAFKGTAGKSASGASMSLEKHSHDTPASSGDSGSRLDKLIEVLSRKFGDIDGI